MQKVQCNGGLRLFNNLKYDQGVLIALFILIKDPAVVWTASARIIGTIGTVGVLPLVVIYLSPIEQGIYFIFLSLMTAQVFFELGFSTVVIQKISHARGFLNINSTDDNFDHVANLICFSVKFYILMSVAFFFAFSTFGLFFIATQVKTAGEVSWKAPWLLFAVGVALSLIGLGLTSIAEGMGKVKMAVQIRAIGMTLRFLCLAIGLVSGAGLWSLSFAVVFSSILMICIVIFYDNEILCKCREKKRDSSINWRNDILPFQWRIGVSCLSGFFIFQTMTLAVAAKAGAPEAGRFGLAMQICIGLISLSLCFISPKQAVWAALVGGKKWAELERSFISNFYVAIASYAVMTLISVMFLACFAWWWPVYSERLPTFPVILTLGAAGIFILFSNATGVFLRSFGSEPYVWTSISFGVGMMLLAIVAKSVNALSVGYLVLSIVICGFWGGYIFQCRRNSMRKLINK